MTSQNTSRTNWREPTLLGVLATGGVALAVILATAVVYIGNADVLALGIVGLMAAATAYGVVELARCVRALGQLDAALLALPAEATAADLEGADKRLRSLLRARIEGVGRPLRGAEFTPYLVGLLVMLGLLGTFLGLFDAMRGARMVVAGSRDAHGLQEALSAPLGGLTLSFGTSAAGLAASAMLGLGAVLLRRRERQVDQRMAEAVTGPLADLSPARRQERLLEQAAAQTAAMPDAAAALRTAVDQLGGLGELWASQQRESAERSSAAFADAAIKVTDAFERGMKRSAESLEQLLGDVRGTLDASIAQATAAVGDTMRPLVERAVDGAVGAATDHLTEAQALLDRDLQARSERDAQRWQHFDERVDGLLGRLDDREAARRAADHTAVEARAAADQAATEARIAADRAAAEARMAADQAAATRLRDQLDALVARIEESDEQRRSADASTAAARVAADRAASERVREQLEAVLARIEATEQARAEADERAAAARLAAETAAAERTTQQLDTVFERTTQQLDTVFERIDVGVGAQHDSMTQLCRSYDEQVDALTKAHREHVVALTARLDADLEARRAFEEQQWQTVVDRVAQLADTSREQAESDRGERLATAAAVRDLFVDTANRDKDRSEQLGRLADQIAGELEAITRVARTQTEEITGAVRQQLEAVTSAVTQQLTDTSELTTAQMGTVADADVARHERAAETMAALSEASETLVERIAAAVVAQREQLEQFEGRLLQMHKAAFDAAGNRLKVHVDQVGEQLSHVAGSTRSASDKLAAGSGELTAVAQMLAASVDRHRDAANLWLDSLGAVDAAVQEAGESAAAEALAKQLASTSELFAQQLEFHREMFEQLKHLRGSEAAARAAAATTAAATPAGADHVRA